MPVASLLDWNNLDSTTIFRGQTLIVNKPVYYTVKKGDSLTQIAKNYGTTVQTIKDLNKLTSNTIYVGQRLTLPNAARETGNSTTYTVKRGDTLSKIAKEHGTTVKAIKDANGLTSDTIHVGQTLKLSGSASAAQTYTVKPGDTLYSIAVKHGTTVQAIKKANGLTSNSIRVGQTLKLSGKPSAVQPSANIVEALIAEGKKYIGVPYVWGGTSPAGFDCSGFLHYVFLQNGISIPRTVETIWNAGKPVASPLMGDLVFFETYKKGPSHAGIYLGNGQFLHASTSAGVTISNMDNPYWSPRYLGAKQLH